MKDGIEQVIILNDFVKKILSNQIDLEPEFTQIINYNITELLYSDNNNKEMKYKSEIAQKLKEILD